MNTVELLREQLTATYNDMVSGAVALLPKLIVAVVLVTLAWLFAKILQIVLRGTLRRLRFDAAVEKIGLSKTLKQLGTERPLSEVLPRVAYWLLLFLFARTLADNLGLEPISQAIGSLLAYMPAILSAVIVLVAGSLVSQFASTTVSRMSEAAGLDFGEPLGRVVGGLVLFIAMIMAVSQLRIDTDIVRIVTACALAGLGLAFGLAFGLGTRRTVQDILSGFYARKVFQIGDQVEIIGRRGELVELTPTMAVLESNEGRFVVSNSTLTEQVTAIDEAPAQDSDN